MDAGRSRNSQPSNGLRLKLATFVRRHRRAQGGSSMLPSIRHRRALRRGRARHRHCPMSTPVPAPLTPPQEPSGERFRGRDGLRADRLAESVFRGTERAFPARSSGDAWLVFPGGPRAAAPQSPQSVSVNAPPPPCSRRSRPDNSRRPKIFVQFNN
jgi:hypothetical protein